MKTTLVTAPTTTPISLTEAKAHLNVTISDDDTMIGVYMSAAISVCEQILQRKLITQTWKVYLDSWPAEIVLPFGDLQSVTHVKYTDEDGVQATFSPDYYTVDTVAVPGRIVLKPNETWPTDTLFNVNPIEIQFVTGYGDAATDVPDGIRSAALLMVSHFYENRESYLISDFKFPSVNEIPMTTNALLSHHRVWRWAL